MSVTIVKAVVFVLVSIVWASPFVAVAYTGAKFVGLPWWARIPVTACAAVFVLLERLKIWRTVRATGAVPMY